MSRPPSEAGFPDLTFDGVSGIYGWRDMPAEIKQRIATDISAIIADPAFRARVSSVGTAPRTGTPEEFAAAIEDAARQDRGDPCCDRQAGAVTDNAAFAFRGDGVSPR